MKLQLRKSNFYSIPLRRGGWLWYIAIAIGWRSEGWGFESQPWCHIQATIHPSDGSGSNFIAQVGSAIFGSGLGLVSHFWFGLGFGKFSPKNPKFFNFLHFGPKNLIGSGQKKYPGKSPVGLLFIVGQKHARVGSRQSLGHIVM